VFIMNFKKIHNKHEISFDESQVRAKNIRLAQENNMTGSHKKQRYYETVHRTVSQTVDKVAKPCRA
jgi:hypothetical protein